MQSGSFLKLTQRQQLALTPQLQQSIRLLQVSAQELEAEIAQALQENPMLEQLDPADAEEPRHDAPGAQVQEYDIDDAPSQQIGGPAQPEYWSVSSFPNRARRSDPYDDMGVPEQCSSQSLAEYLQNQLHLTRAAPDDCVLVEILIGELDENGYLPGPLDGLMASFPDAEADPAQWRVALHLLQSFDPPGVGACSLSECLQLQLRQRVVHNDTGSVAMISNVTDKNDDESTDGSGMDVGSADGGVLDCAMRIARDHLDLLAAGRTGRLCEVLGCPLETVQAAHALLLTLDPRPGAPWSDSTADYVVPDVLVRKVSGHWRVLLNPSAVPRLRVNPEYERALHGVADEGARQWQTHAQKARGFIKSVDQRFSTVARVMQAIVAHQQAFFDHGVGAMRPLLLRDIAQELGVHESTVSRATRQKYAQTPWGVFEIKRFFNVPLAGSDGQAASSGAVRALIAELIARESPKKPLSDSRIAEALARRGVVVARRTVAKYREAAGIEAASVRKARAAAQT
jgi:RNA polymerase sigma-54 factor